MDAERRGLFRPSLMVASVSIVHRNKLLIMLVNLTLFSVIVFLFLYMWLLQKWGGVAMVVFMLCCSLIFAFNYSRKRTRPEERQAYLDGWLLKDIGRRRQGQQEDDSCEDDGD